MRRSAAAAGHHTITVTMPRTPSAGIDSNHLLIDLKTDDDINTVGVES